MGSKLIIFPSVHYTLSGESVLKANNIPNQVTPVPPYVNGGCGLGIIIAIEMMEKVIDLFTNKKVRFEKIIDCIK